MTNDIPKGTLCENCGKREATIKWVGSGGYTDLAHGYWSPWCEQCSIEAQIEHIKKRMADLPGLEKRLAELVAKEQ